MDSSTDCTSATANVRPASRQAAKSSRKKMGRPPLDPEDRRSVRLQVFMRPADAKRLEALARESGQPLQSWALAVLLARLSGNGPKS